LIDAVLAAVQGLVAVGVRALVECFAGAIEVLKIVKLIPRKRVIKTGEIAKGADGEKTQRYKQQRSPGLHTHPRLTASRKALTHGTAREGGALLQTSYLVTRTPAPGACRVCNVVPECAEALDRSRRPARAPPSVVRAEFAPIGERPNATVVSIVQKIAFGGIHA
jgi:hypothetical protein